MQQIRRPTSACCRRRPVSFPLLSRSLRKQHVRGCVGEARDRAGSQPRTEVQQSHPQHGVTGTHPEWHPGGGGQTKTAHGGGQKLARKNCFVGTMHTGGDRKSTRLNSSHVSESRMPSS